MATCDSCQEGDAALQPMTYSLKKSQSRIEAVYELTLRYQSSARALVALELRPMLSSKLRAIEQAVSAVFALLL